MNLKYGIKAENLELVGTTYPEVLVVPAFYLNDIKAMRVFTPEGELIATATVNLPEAKWRLRDNETFIKDYSENEGILEWLVKNDIVRSDPTLDHPSGFVTMRGAVIIHEELLAGYEALAAQYEESA